MSEEQSSDTTPGRCAWRSPRAWAVLLFVLGTGLALDLGLKHWTFENIADEPVDIEQLLATEPDGHIRNQPVEGRPVLPWGLLNFRLVLNPGAVFGIGANQRGFFIAFTCVALAAGLCVFGFWTRDRSRLAHVAIGLILAGGLGNLYDRMAYGVVRDYLYMLSSWKLPFNLTWGSGGSDRVFPWVFNLADTMLLVGMALLMIQLNRSDSRKKSKKRADEAAAQDSPQSDSPSAA